MSTVEEKLEPDSSDQREKVAESIDELWHESRQTRTEIGHLKRRSEDVLTMINSSDRSYPKAKQLVDDYEADADSRYIGMAMKALAGIEGSGVKMYDDTTNGKNIYDLRHAEENKLRETVLQVEGYHRTFSDEG